MGNAAFSRNWVQFGDAQKFGERVVIVRKCSAKCFPNRNKLINCPHVSLLAGRGIKPYQEYRTDSTNTPQRSA